MAMNHAMKALPKVQREVIHHGPPIPQEFIPKYLGDEILESKIYMN